MMARWRIAAAALVAGLAGTPGAAGALVLQIDEPWATAGPNTGTVGETAVTLTSSGDRWRSSFTDESPLFSRADLFGAGAQPAGTIGDFAVLSFGPGQSDLLQVEIAGPLLDPIFFLTDIDVVGATVTVTRGGAALVSNADGQWTGQTLTTLSGAPDTVGAFATVRYAGLFEAGTSFGFEITYPGDFSVDTLGLGIVAVPEPTTASMLGALPLLLIARRAWRR